MQLKSNQKKRYVVIATIQESKPERTVDEQRNKHDETEEQKRNIMQLLEEQSSDESLKICHREAKKEGGDP